MERVDNTPGITGGTSACERTVHYTDSLLVLSVARNDPFRSPVKLVFNSFMLPLYTAALYSVSQWPLTLAIYTEIPPSPPPHARSQVTVQRSILLNQLNGYAASLAAFPEPPCGLPSGGSAPSLSAHTSMAATDPNATWKVTHPTLFLSP